MVPNTEGLEIKYCYPTCKFLRCQQKALGRRFKKNNNELVVACNFAPGEVCEGHKCKYSFCVKYKMTPNGRCKLNLVSQRKIKEEDDIIERKDQVKTIKSLKIKNKILKKIQDYDEF